ncbi:hypothetical protein [Falsirhodobacter sp. 1013]|uniref:hypothetical protein n=1 Tax=Falsirhodobacter sp. 1013 TaxID=3417566 RepID=UPI003EBCEAC2
MPSTVPDFEKTAKLLEEHGFTIVDFTPEHVRIRLFKWNVHNEAADVIDRLEPFQDIVLSV